MKTGEFIRHGDVKIERISRFPEGKRTTVADRIVARGEVTGHAHSVEEGGAELFMVGETMFLEVGDDGIRIIHEEHGSLEIPSGRYQIGIDREYDYSAQAVRRVAD